MPLTLDFMRVKSSTCLENGCGAAWKGPVILETLVCSSIFQSSPRHVPLFHTPLSTPSSSSTGRILRPPLSIGYADFRAVGQFLALVINLRPFPINELP